MEKEAARQKGIPGSWLKLAALVTMLIDHIAATVIARALLAGGFGTPHSALPDWVYSLYLVMRALGRIAFPLYCFLLVEGFSHTSNRMKYALRLLLFALVSEVPFDMAIKGSLVDMSGSNVFFTLFIGLLAITAADAGRRLIQERLKERRMAAVIAQTLTTALILLAAGLLAELVLHTDYGACGVMVIYIIYLFKENRLMGYALGVAVLAVLLGDLEFAALAGLVPLYFYNGARGRQPKYFFYAFYPAHLLLLALVCYALGYGI